MVVWSFYCSEKTERFLQQVAARYCDADKCSFFYLTHFESLLGAVLGVSPWAVRVINVQLVGLVSIKAQIGLRSRAQVSR